MQDEYEGIKQVVEFHQKKNRTRILDQFSKKKKS